MIINFSVQNFGSIKDKQTLSFEADKSTHLEDYYVIQAADNLRLLKLALIYGANASGVIRNTSNIYNAYKTGKLGGIPRLGDNYIGTNNETE